MTRGKQRYVHQRVGKARPDLCGPAEPYQACRRRCAEVVNSKDCNLCNGQIAHGGNEYR